MKLKHILMVLAALALIVVACGAVPRKSSGKGARRKITASVGKRKMQKRNCRYKRRPCRRRIKSATKKQTPPEKQAENPPTSNMLSMEDKKYVETRLKSALNPENVELLMKLIEDYNRAAAPYLTADFTKKVAPTYDVGKITEAQSKGKREYPDTNCRITSYLLLKNNMEVSEKTEEDGELLFMDREALSRSNLLNEKEMADFMRLFSRVKTGASKDPAEQGKVMASFLSKMHFPKNVAMMSVVLHDNLDGNYLFIGHVGVLVKDGDGYLFVEKISFEEPYQAVKFKTKEECYRYLKNKYKDYRDPQVAPPFIMENDRYIG